MQYILIFLFSIFIFSSCSSNTSLTNSIEEKQLEEKKEMPKFKWELVSIKDFEYKTYNSGTILEVYALKEIYTFSKKVLDLNTMEKVEEIDYNNSNACLMAYCPRYKILVDYNIDSIPESFKRYEYVVDHPHIDGPNELIDDSDFYKNK